MFRPSLNSITKKTEKLFVRFSGFGLLAGVVLMTTLPASAAETGARNHHRSVYDNAAPAPGFNHPTEDLFLGNGDEFPGNPDNFPLRGAPDRLPSRGSPEIPVIPSLPSTPVVPVTPSAPVVHPEDKLSESEKINLKLTARYSNPVIIRFVNSVSADQAIRLYQEASGLIDTRHIEPTSYDARVRQALKSLSMGVENKAFLEANRLSLNANQVRTFQDQLARLPQTRQIQTANDSLQMLNTTIAIGQQIGLRPTAVVLEFVHGSTDSLDKYSAFEPTEEARRPSADLEDHIVGIGVEIKPHDDGMLVIRALRGGPAAEAGLQGDDIITAIDGKNLKGKGLDYAVDLIKGTEGSRLTLTVNRDGQNSNVTLARRRVEIHSVSEVKMLDDSVGYVKLDKFAQNSSNEMDQALWNLHRQGMKSLVIDLRGNPGGLLTTAIELSDKFLPSGSIVSTRGRNTTDNSAEYAKYEQTWKTPLVVLVDENSASASEIFAAAIQENGRGLIVGRRSYGKGTVQTHFPLQTVSGNLRLTTAKFYSPNGRAMAGAGVDPDVKVELISTGTKGPDRDIEMAVNVAKSQRLTDMAASKSKTQMNSLSRFGS